MKIMTKQQSIVLACILFGIAHSVNVDSDSRFLDNAGLERMARVFARSEKVHQESMALISHRMSLEKSVEVLKRRGNRSAALTEVTNMVLGGAHLRKQPKGYSGVEGARKLLNDMIFEAMTKYDEEIAKCTDYYSKQCAAMEVCRGQIAGANYIAANSRALILDAQANINRCEVDIPTRKYELAQHLLKCKAELYKLNTRPSRLKVCPPPNAAIILGGSPFVVRVSSE